MLMLGWLLIGAGSILGIVFLWAIVAGTRRTWRERGERSRLQAAKSEFHLRREWLEAQFITAGSNSGKPRGLRWADCDFHNEVSFCRDRSSHELCALVGVAISFEAIEGGGMEDNPNVERQKFGSALFRYDGRHWQTEGRALLNLDPSEAIEHLRNELETVD